MEDDSMDEFSFSISSDLFDQDSTDSPEKEISLTEDQVDYYTELFFKFDESRNLLFYYRSYRVS